jgi:hypothetical protein
MDDKNPRLIVGELKINSSDVCASAGITLPHKTLMETTCKFQIKNLEPFVQNSLQKYSAWQETPSTNSAGGAPFPMA